MNPTPPAAPACLCTPYSSKPDQKGGTLIFEGVDSLQEHRQLLGDPDAYRPQRCGCCGCLRLHAHDCGVAVPMATPDHRRCTPDGAALAPGQAAMDIESPPPSSLLTRPVLGRVMRRGLNHLFGMPPRICAIKRATRGVTGTATQQHPSRSAVLVRQEYLDNWTVGDCVICRRQRCG